MAKFGRNGVGPAKPEKPGALDRVTALEEFREELLRAVRQTFSVVENRLQGLEEVTEAIVNKFGRDDIENEVKRLHIERLEKKAEQEKIALEGAIKGGQVVEGATIGDLSVVVGSEVDKDGNTLYPSRVQLLFATMKEEYKVKLRGAKVGDVVETPFGSKFTVAAIYDIVPPDPKKPAPARAAHPAETLPVSSPPQVEQPLTEAEEQELVEQLEAVAEQIKADAEAVEESLVEELAGNVENA